PDNQIFNGQKNHVDILNADLTSDASNFVARSGNNPAHWGLDKPLPPGHPGWLTEDLQSIQGWTPIEDPAPQDPEFYMSQDEAIGYIMGLALIYKCMGDAQQIVPETNQNCKYTAQQYALLIIANILEEAIRMKLTIGKFMTHGQGIFNGIAGHLHIHMLLPDFGLVKVTFRLIIILQMIIMNAWQGEGGIIMIPG
ncbi:MAG: hypothetical protein WCK03_04435, partial [Candidatus Taylorbacteria bacterium]